ncbi:hypothetical protein Tco_1347927 [Tanacetum coccineum]
MVFHKMDTEEISDRFVAPYFVNGLEAYDGEINLVVEENMISNEFAVKLCLDHEVKRGNKVVKKELIVALRGETYFVKFILNSEEDDVYLLQFDIIMDPSSSVGKTCLGENIIEISSDKAEGHGDWNSPEFLDTSNSGGKKETKAMVFHKMDTEEISDRFVEPCFVNGLEAYDGEINLTVEENMISNEFAVKLCLDHNVKRGNKVVKKELIVALRGEIYFVKFILNPEEDDVEPGVVF